MTAEQTIAALRKQVEELRASILSFSLTPEALTTGNIPANPLMAIAQDDIPVPSDPCQRFATADFYAGAIDALDYMIKVAEGTHGSEVWRTCFSTSRQNLTVAAQQKGFNIK